MVFFLASHKFQEHLWLLVAASNPTINHLYATCSKRHRIAVAEALELVLPPF